jgi:cytoskeletal protein CcmA (bactofilin family)
MSLFGRRDNASSTSASPGDSRSQESPAPAPSPSRPQQRRITHIAPGTRIRGEVTGPTELLIEGEVEGEIRVDAPVIVGGEGVVQGPITAQVVRIGGRVFGNVVAADRVEVAPSGTLEGDILSPRITIAEGAFFKGRVEMKSDKPERTGKPEKSEKSEKPEETRRPREGGESGRSTKAPAEPGKS